MKPIVKQSFTAAPVKPAAKDGIKPKGKTLSQAQTDFTSEGAPPPGLVATTPPELPPVKNAKSTTARKT